MKELEAFEAWWSAQETGLGTAHKFTAWNAWLARAAVEADRAQRVPDGWKLVPVDPVRSMVDAAERVDWADSDVRGNIYNMWNVMLASTPAPAQQECWCETCDLAQGNPLGRTRMSLCPECGDKRCPRAKHHDNACAQHQEPPQQERKPMTYREIADATSEWAHVRSDYTIGIIRAAERHHGIKE